MDASAPLADGFNSATGSCRDTISALGEAVSEFGFLVRGGFRASQKDAVPDVFDGVATQTVLLVGSVGDRMWSRFGKDRKDEADPLDRWTQRCLESVATGLGARVVFPFQRPFLPFQHWLKSADVSHVSPLRLLIHPEFGLWHVVRGAFLFADALEIPRQETVAPPCKGCRQHPCMTSCPVDAFSARGLDVGRCASHLASEAGADCMANGCLARRACPVGVSYRHTSEQAAFHMAALQSMHQSMGLVARNGRQQDQ